jgi:hypothetical protein
MPADRAEEVATIGLHDCTTQLVIGSDGATRSARRSQEEDNA